LNSKLSPCNLATINLFSDFSLSRNISKLNIYIRITLHISFKTRTTKNLIFKDLNENNNLKYKYLYIVHNMITINSFFIYHLTISKSQRDSTWIWLVRSSGDNIGKDTKSELWRLLSHQQMKWLFLQQLRSIYFSVAWWILF
jgi:hypothetical protein